MDKIQILRKISQTFFFIRALVVAGFYLSIIGFIVRFILSGNAYINVKIVIIILAIIAGRVFCGWMCPFGFLFDLVYQARVKISRLKKLPTVPEHIHNKLKYFKYVVLVSIIVLAYVLGVRAFIDLYEFSYLLLALFLVLGFIYPRFFCKYVCPVGALLSILARFSIFKLELDKNKCIGCRLCEFKCPMQIKIVDVDKIDQMECVRCFECMSACRKDAIKFGR
ncbi:MAG: ferredoxin-type protein NapH [Methanothermococcus sp.]|uniref:4Fe-4S binding protein n=1 Tax=Methanothermococcus TaxID=155862 RepID=UPI0003772CEB|nr:MULTISPECIES: 4Fe-4S binding protein [Methanothermococcus]MDK2790846.1 ferredoxin-type protein NapH [Methanothermococcus sp.]MDK2988270.1 ferredoxin-type protein NapH [Methanothermococcus sp.]